MLAYLGGLKVYCKCPRVLQGRGEAEKKESKKERERTRKRERERSKVQKFRKVLLVQSKHSSHSPVTEA